MSGANATKRITILLAEDHAIVRQGIRKLLEQEDDLEVVGEAEDGRKAIALVKNLRPAVVVMDIAMPLLNGLEATRQILKTVPGVRVIILSSHCEEAYVKDAMESGAMGFLIKQASAHDLSAGIREVNKGNVFFGPFIARRVVNRQQKLLDQAGRPQPRRSRLTSREMEVLQLIAEGSINNKTATELGIGLKTVEKHREHLMEKLCIHDTAGLTRYAIRAGIIESSVQLTIV
jgi:DNA-binding NarL/FixJ family response regulator